MTLAAGDRVEHAAVEGTGTVIYSNGDAVQVQWDTGPGAANRGWLYYRRDVQPNAFQLLKLRSTLNKAR
jgi:hypothetical protein